VTHSDVKPAAQIGVGGGGGFGHGSGGPGGGPGGFGMLSIDMPIQA
jgi:hypothetical protein